MTPRIAPRHAAPRWAACAALALFATGCAAPAPPPTAAEAAAALGHTLTAPEPAPMPGVESWRRSPTGGPGVTRRESVLPDAGAQGNASLDGTLPDLARPRLQRR